MRKMLALALTLGLAPTAARAEPPADRPAEPAKPAPTKSTKPDKAAKPANKPAAATGKPISLDVPAPAGSDAAPKPHGVDLFPRSVLEKAAIDPAQGPERRPTTLGDDGSWKVHAAQAGVMVGLFGALAALCGGGNCAVPDSWTSWLPDSIEADRGVTIPNPPPIEPTRKAR